MGVLAAATITTMAGWSVGTPASAGGVMASTTILTSAISEDGQQVTLTVTVRDGNNKNGLGITPQGTVTFSDDVGDHLGGVTLPSCLLKPCVATHVVPIGNISAGVGHLRATYSGDPLLKPSTGVDPFSLAACDAEDGCFGAVSYPGADMEVESDSDSGYVVSNFDAVGLPCGVVGGGPVGHVVGVGLNGEKEIYYMLTGAGAQAYHTMFSNGHFSNGDNTAWFCYVSPDPFEAYSPDGYHTDFPEGDESYATFGDAPQIVGGPYNGDYVGLLGWCPTDSPPIDSDSAHSNAELTTDGPCLNSFAVYQNSDAGNEWELSVNLTTPPGDPFLGGKKLLAPKKV